MTESDPMTDEFDTVASWTAEAVAQLGERYALPAACRGSGSPAALDWLASAMGLGARSRLLDSGAGVGGPAAYVARTLDVAPVLAEPMPGACRAAADLFGNPVVVADGSALPFGDGAFDAAWSLGVLCTVPDKRAHLGELVRVVGSGGRVGLLVYARTVEELPDQPAGNHFPTEEELATDLGRCGLLVLDRAPLADLAGTPDDWQEAADEVEQLVAAQHGQDDRWRSAQDQQDAITRLIEDELVVGVLVSCTVA